ncbi:hypothetical protein OQA88_5474 [Cercophora sp. LCS_1]
MSALPTTKEALLQTGIMDPDFEAAWKARGAPRGEMPTDISTLKGIVSASLPELQKKFAQSRPSNIAETEHHLPLSTGFTSRLLICHPTNTPEAAEKPSPIIILFHGGIHVLGLPEFDLPLARTLATAHNATIICPSTRKAPETAFPGMLDDAWAILQATAHATQDSGTSFLPPNADPAAGLIVGGTSSGANFADVVAHLARDNNLSPPLTGVFLACGGFMDPERGVPSPHKERYLSREQNRDAPIANEKFIKTFVEAINPDRESPLWAPFDWPAGSGEDGGDEKLGHAGMPPVYFQVCGMDINRDDGLVYEAVLRGCGVRTRVDLYRGLPHCWWDAYPDLEASKRRLEDTVEGFGWLLE